MKPRTLLMVGMLALCATQAMSQDASGEVSPGLYGSTIWSVLRCGGLPALIAVVYAILIGILWKRHPDKGATYAKMLDEGCKVLVALLFLMASMAFAAQFGGGGGMDDRSLHVGDFIDELAMLVGSFSLAVLFIRLIKILLLNMTSSSQRVD